VTSWLCIFTVGWIVFAANFLHNAMQKPGVYLGYASVFVLHYSMQKNFHRDHPPCNHTEFGQCSIFRNVINCVRSACIDTEPTGATGHLPRYSWKYRGKDILLSGYFLVNNFYSFPLTSSVTWHMAHYTVKAVSWTVCHALGERQSDGLNRCCAWGGGWCVSQDQYQPLTCRLVDGNSMNKECVAVDAVGSMPKLQPWVDRQVCTVRFLTWEDVEPRRPTSPAKHTQNPMAWECRGSAWRG